MSTRFYSLSLSLQWSRKVVPNRSFWRLSPSSSRALFSMTMDDEFRWISEPSTVYEWMDSCFLWRGPVLFRCFFRASRVLLVSGGGRDRWDHQICSQDFHLRMTMLLRKHGGWRFWACPSFFVWYKKSRTPWVIHESSLQFAGSQPVEVSRICVSWWLLFTRSLWHHELPCLVGVTLVVCSKSWSNCRSCLEKNETCWQNKELATSFFTMCWNKNYFFRDGWKRYNCLITSIDLFHSCFIRILSIRAIPPFSAISHQRTICLTMAEFCHLPIGDLAVCTTQQNSIVFPRNCRNWKTFLPVAWPIWGLADSCLFQDPSLTWISFESPTNYSQLPNH